MTNLLKNFLKIAIIEKLRKKFIYEIALARIKEISEIIIFNNVNFKYYNKFANTIFLENLRSRAYKWS